MNQPRTANLSDFPTRRLLTDDDFVAPAGVVMNAPRPLYGEDVDIDRMGFTVQAPTDPAVLRLNLDLDAYILVFVSRSEAIAEMKAMITADYPSYDLAEADDDDLLAMWVPA